MAFFHIHKKEEPHYTLNIEKFLVDNSIPYDLDDTEDIMKLSYLNPLGEETYVFFFAEDKYYYQGKIISEDEIKKMLSDVWKSDRMLKKYLDSPKYTDIFDIADFFDDSYLKTKIYKKFIPLKSANGIRLLYGQSPDANESNYIAGVELTDMGDMVILPTGMKVDANAAVLDILVKLDEALPDLFGDSYKIKEDSRFTDIVKTYFINIDLKNRLNIVYGVEAHIMDIQKNLVMFVLFPNDAALEYISPTIQHEDGQILLIDYDEENTVEDNGAIYRQVIRILDLSKKITDKPDEENLPPRFFTK